MLFIKPPNGAITEPKQNPVIKPSGAKSAIWLNPKHVFSTFCSNSLPFCLQLGSNSKPCVRGIGSGRCVAGINDNCQFQVIDVLSEVV